MNKIIPREVLEGFGSVISLIYELENDYTPYDTTKMKMILKDFPFSGLGLNVKIRIKAYKALEWIVDHPEIDYALIEPNYIHNNEIYFQKMKMLFETMKALNFCVNMDRSELVSDVEFQRDFASVADVPLFIKLNFYLIGHIIYKIEMRRLVYNFDSLREYVDNGGYSWDHSMSNQTICEVLDWVEKHPETNYKAIMPWHILDNKLYYERMMMLREVLIERGFC